MGGIRVFSPGIDVITRESLFSLGIDPGIWAQPLADAMGLNEIDTPEREAMFIAQVAHESGGFRALVENLNYSPQGLLATFPRYFTPAEAVAYAHDGPRIANRVYANRMGNGDEASGDGWRYRGRGLIGTTGANNYRRCGAALGVDLIAGSDLLQEPIYAALSAGWFWRSNGLNELSDAGAFGAITRRIVGGAPYDAAGKPINGQADRELWLRKVRASLS